ASVAGVGIGLASYLSPFAKQNAIGQSAPSANVLGSNDSLRVAVIGTNGRGMAHIECLQLPNVSIAAICDVDSRAVAKGVKDAAKRQPDKDAPKGFKDFRQVLEDKSIDAVTIATPDHWHTPMAILALAAGKHVYVEKPCSHNPREGELLIAAVARYGRVCQMGNQRIMTKRLLHVHMLAR